MNIEIYTETYTGTIEATPTRHFWVYKDLSNPHGISEQNKFYRIKGAVCQFQDAAVRYIYMKGSKMYTRVGFDDLSPDVQEIILRDYPELEGEDEFEQFCGQYEVT